MSVVREFVCGLCECFCECGVVYAQHFCGQFCVTVTTV